MNAKTSVIDLLNTDATLHSVEEEGSGGAKMHLDTLKISFQDEDVESYLKEKQLVIAELQRKVLLGETEVPSEALLNFEQTLAHEAYHIYQTVTSSFLAEYSFAKRSHSLILLRLFARNIELGNLFSTSDNPFDHLIDNTKNELEEELFDLIKTGRKETVHTMNYRPTSDDITIREIIEGGAVAFQLLSQFDVHNKKLKLSGSVYSRAWEKFTCLLNIDQTNSSQLGYARLTFLYLTDVFLKFFGIYFKSTREFHDALRLVVPLVKTHQEYQDDFFNPRVRDQKFLASLKHVERDKGRIEKILEYCGTLPEEGQLQLYINIRLYADVYKKVAIAGAPERNRPSFKKDEAVGLFLKQKFSFWGSDFTIPCILSNYQVSSEFSMMWKDFDEIKFIDDTQNRQISVAQENYLLAMLEDLKAAFDNHDFRCCSIHKSVKINVAMKCTNTNSLNEKCRMIFGKYLKEFIVYE